MIGALIGAVAGIGGALLSGSAQKKAAKTAAASMDRSAEMNTALAREMYGKNSANMSPFMGSGQRANALLDGFLGTGAPQAGAGASNMQYGAPEPMGGGNALGGAPGGNPQDAFRQYIANSDYGFQFDQGSNALNLGLASRGMIQSGAAMKDMERFRQNLQQGYRGEYMDRLSGQQNVGLAGASALAGVGQNMVNNVSQNNNMAASANANAALMRGAATSNMLGGIGQSIGNAMGGMSFGGSSYGGGPTGYSSMGIPDYTRRG